MIPVHPQPEPASFNQRVRLPGGRFLQKHRQPIAKQWKSHAYWTQILSDLHDAYRGICAYSCHWIPYDTGSDTVEHFQPKKLFPREAYEWANYRLVCGTLNGRKGTDQQVLDPFKVQDDWFVLDFPSLLVKPAPGLRKAVAQSVLHTISLLGLNDEGTCLRARVWYVKDYCTGHITFQHLEENAPFIAREVQRQGLVTTVRAIMGY